MRRPVMRPVATLAAAMRTWVIGLLLAVMPLQFVWAGIAVYCHHQADVVTEHVGHHDHEHAASMPSSEPVPDAPGADKGSPDNDCALCHLNCAQSLGETDGPWMGAASTAPVATAPVRFATRGPEGFERPNWQRLARSASREEMRIR